jgi:hypothetical protein
MKPSDPVARLQHDPDIRDVLVKAFKEYLDDVLDDPAWIAGEAPTYIAKLRKTAAWLELDFDALLNADYRKFQVERLRTLERGGSAV